LAYAEKRAETLEEGFFNSHGVTFGY